MFEDMVSRIHSETAQILLKVEVKKREDGTTQANNQISAGASVKSADKVGRNDPCPCGSGLKYKNCCGKR